MSQHCTRRWWLGAAVGICLILVGFGTSFADPPVRDPLSTWNDSPSKKAITAFVRRVTTEGPDFVAVDDRIAVFDNDGTLWCEQPVYVQVAFALSRVRALAPEHPDWKDRLPFKAVLDGDHRALAAGGQKGLVEIVAATHTGMPVDEFQSTVSAWLHTARHPRFQRPYTECIYQPMVELLAYLRSNGFKTFIVSGGTTDFMRPWALEAYGVPAEQVVGTTFKTRYEFKEGRSRIIIQPEIDLVDDHAGKPVGIERAIGKRPILAFGNSDGDFEMLEYTTSSPGPRLGLIVHHTDAEREYAYDRQSAIGRLDKALDEAPRKGWIVVDMKSEWRQVFPTLKQ
ncbi:MAG TPA: HAD family hydrolase [Caulifigura sp.]|nr:HAD family hydrolase [Caulifigura sp.]